MKVKVYHRCIENHLNAFVTIVEIYDDDNNMVERYTVSPYSNDTLILTTK